MKFSFAWIQELSASSLSIEDASALLTSKAFEVVLSDVPGVLDIDILPNRPDALSHLGVARELAALTSQRFTAPSYEWRVSDEPVKKVTIHDASCVRYSGLLIRDVRIGPSPTWLVERLALCGLQSINNVVDVTNYVMLELGQPMHAFDASSVKQIDVRRARTGEQLVALDEARTTHALDETMLVIADGDTPIALAGIKGGVGTGICENTTDIFLEAANFLPESIRATSRKLNLRTDASIRFSYGVDPNLTAPALQRAAELIAKVAQGSAHSSIVDVYPHPVTSRSVLLDEQYVRDLLGIELQSSQMRGILESLGFRVQREQSEKCLVEIPSRRSDVIGQEDLAEEIGRVYGFDAITSIAPELPIYSEHSWVKEETAVVWDEYTYLRERSAIGRLLVGAGYSEVYNYVFLSDEMMEVLKATHAYELAQPQSPEYRWLRTSLVPRLLINARDNLRFHDAVQLFETGHVFRGVGEGKEQSRIGLIAAHRDASREMFFDLKGAVSLIAERLGLADVYFDDAEPMAWDVGAINATLPGRRAVIRDGNDRVIGFIGSVHGRVASALKLKGSAAVAELDLRSLIEFAQREREFVPLPKYPDVIRDVAILVPQTTQIDTILQTVQESDTQQLVQDVDVFDIFVPTGKEKQNEDAAERALVKSVAFHIVFRSDERTLTDIEVEKALLEIQQALQAQLGAKIR